MCFPAISFYFYIYGWFISQFKRAESTDVTSGTRTLNFQNAQESIEAIQKNLWSDAAKVFSISFLRDVVFFSLDVC